MIKIAPKSSIIASAVKKIFQTHRHAVAEQRQNAERKRNVGCHWNAEAALGWRTRIEK